MLARSETAPESSLPSLELVGVVGAGAMGVGIAAAVAMSGTPVRCLTRSRRSLDQTRSRLAASFGVLVNAGLLDEDASRRAVALVSFADDIPSTVAGCSLVVESVKEELELKQAVLAEIAAAAPPSAIITTNTSSLSLPDLERAVTPPERFAGLHWFLPAELVQVVEIVRGPSTSAATAQALTTFVQRLRKHALHVRKPVPGFVVNRLQYALLREAHALLRDGVCTPEDLDAALVHALGPRWAAVGPLESMDLAGLDVHLAVAEQLFPSLSDSNEPPQHLRAMVEGGDLGAKSGTGLRGSYDAQRLVSIARRRAETVRALRDRTGSST
ncbi:MAG: 3-hydroxybutyryl-CoA dehydrogenase [Naasia sp.]|jgi:3-hydroxybutyryl-CoA dehydrogenase|uniref:3-hydroxyacyl-CoA dehydrogenase family protein n=1 Tax=Naasia sp. TaxID=2546198 RepID=UPI00343F01E6|nr:3-hydroxybutyryl-CoA dehydrogenase [Naasia sp.]